MENKTHLCETILLEPKKEPLENIFQQTPIEADNRYPGFTKKMMVYGITFLAGNKISDSFMFEVAETLKKMFPRSSEMNLELQEKVLQNVYRYNGIIPFIHYDDEPTIDETLDSSLLMKENSIADIIIEGSKTQANEVVEHLLHFITAIGLHHTLPEIWGAGTNSTAEIQMNQAAANKYYDVNKYDDFEDQREVVLLQEYVYWLITSIWNLQERYGLGEDEWLLKNEKTVIEKHPTSYELFQATIPAIMTSPGYADLDKYGC